MPGAPRIVSLLPAATEIIAALGHARAIVGRSHECDFPPEVADAPIVSRPREGALSDPQAPAPAIHSELTRLLTEALSIYRVDLDLLLSLRPDLVVTQAQCAVCAVDLDTVAAALTRSGPSRPRLVSLAASTFAGVLEDVDRIAEALGAVPAGAALCERLSQHAQAIARRAARASRPRIAVIEWIEPLMGAGNWVPELVRLAGGEPLFGRAGAHTPWIEPDQLRRADPDVILVAPCGLSLQRAREALAEAWPRLGWQRLTAARQGRVNLADGNACFNRPGPRLAESLEVLAELLHPDRFRFGHEGRYWSRFSM